MIKKILIAVVAFVVILVGIIALRPNEFRVTRFATINAPQAAVFNQINDFHNWESWSPWAKLDPNAKNTFEGQSSGEGAKFSWEGNDKVGSGIQTIVESRPNDLIRIKLEFLKPFQATNTAEFRLTSNDEETTVSWSMYGKNNFISKAMGLFINCDKMIGADFEKGLMNLKTLVEQK